MEGETEMLENENNNGFNMNPEHNDSNRRKNNNKVPIIITVSIILFVLFICVVVAIGAIRDGNSATSDLFSNKDAQNTTQKYDDIGSTDTDKTANSGSVTVTDASGVVSDTMPSVVSITSKTVIDSKGYDSIYDYYFGGGSSNRGKYEQEGAGSGIIIDQTSTELLIVTNNHVVEGADSLKVQFYDQDAKNAVDGQVKGTDANADVAVVAVELKNIPKDVLSKIKKATLGDSDTLKVGEGVIAIGNALGYGQSVTTGVISAKDREVTIENKKMKLLQTDAAINGGNSGGALLNAKGEVIGINVAKYSSDGSTSASVEGMGFAIPITSVKSIISNLETKKTRQKVDEGELGYLGIRGYDVTEDVSAQYAMPAGAYVYETTKNGPADKAGIQASDVITKFDGQSVTSMSALQSIMEYYKAGEKVKVMISYRDGREYKEKEVTVTLGKQDVINNFEND